MHTLEHAVEMGLGSREYTLLDITSGVDNVYFPFEATDEKLDELISHFPEEDAAIEAMEPNGEDDTWAFYVYLIGSDLESDGMDNLALITKLMTEDKASEISAAKKEQRNADLLKFVSELQAQGMEPPAILYQPTINYGNYADEITEDDPDAEGAASYNLKQMLSL